MRLEASFREGDDGKTALQLYLAYLLATGAPLGFARSSSAAVPSSLARTRLASERVKAALL